MNEVQMTFYSLLNFFDRTLWLKLFIELERMFGQRLSHLDVNDPMRKKVSNLESASDYISSLRDQECSRKIFGKFGGSKIEISLSSFKVVTLSPNSFSIYFPEKYSSDPANLIMLINTFEECNRCLRPFYSICDSTDIIASKRKATGYSVDLQAELIGVFWLTYFNKTYSNFLGKSKFQEIPSRDIDGLDGSMVELGSSPFSINVTRDKAETVLGRQSFVDAALGFDKPIGKNALTFDRLS